MSGRQHANPVEAGSLGGHAEEVEEIVECPHVGRRPNHARSEQRLGLGGPEQPAVLARVIERRDAGSVAAQQQLSPAAVPQSGGKLPPGIFKHALALLFVQMDPGLCVAVGREPVPALEELFADRTVFEQLTFEGHPHVAVFVSHGLASARDVDDRQPTRPGQRPARRASAGRQARDARWPAAYSASVRAKKSDCRLSRVLLQCHTYASCLGSVSRVKN